MQYKSPLTASRRTLLMQGTGIGAVFSFVSYLTFGRIGVLQSAAAVIFGAVEGFIISGLGLAIQILFPSGAQKRMQRMILEFLMGASIHAFLSFVMRELGGARILFLSWIVGFLSTVVGELVCANESAVLAHEEAALAAEGRTRLPADVKERYGLSDRETEVAELLVARASYREICDRLFISLPTVKSHVSAIYRKSEVSSRREFIMEIERLRKNLPARILS